MEDLVINDRHRADLHNQAKLCHIPQKQSRTNKRLHVQIGHGSYYVIEVSFNSIGVLHTKIYMFGKFLEHAWSQYGGLNKEHSISVGRGELILAPHGMTR